VPSFDVGGGQRQLLATCCDFPALLPTACLMKLPLTIPSLPLPGPLSAPLSVSVVPPLNPSAVALDGRDAPRECTVDSHRR